MAVFCIAISHKKSLVLVNIQDPAAQLVLTLDENTGVIITILRIPGEEGPGLDTWFGGVEEIGLGLASIPPVILSNSDLVVAPDDPVITIDGF